MKTLSNIPFILLSTIALAFGTLLLITVFLLHDPHITKEVDIQYLERTAVMTATLFVAFGAEALLFRK